MRHDPPITTSPDHAGGNSHLHIAKSATSAAESRTIDLRKLRPIRRPELRKLVPLSDTTIYEMEQRGEFPRRFFLTSRCVVWDLSEVETWLAARREASDAGAISKAAGPDVRKRRTRPVR